MSGSLRAAGSPNGNIFNVLAKENTSLAARRGWVLAGGRSSRMGSDKAFMEIGGRPLALIVAGRLAQVCRSVSIVGDPAAYGPFGLPVVADHFPGRGPLAGIEAALAATDTEWNLIAACDMPALDTAFLETLFGCDADCALPVHPDGKTEPLCAVYHRRILPVIRTALESGVRRVTDALQTLAVRYVPVDSAAPFENLNTPADLRRYLHG